MCVFVCVADVCVCVRGRGGGIIQLIKPNADTVGWSDESAGRADRIAVDCLQKHFLEVDV